MELARGVAGLRLVADALEFVDREGAPRLHMAPPYVLSQDDAGGVQRTKMTVSVVGCAVDSDTCDPRGRAPIPAGASACEVQLSWEGDRVTYPALVDPVWSTTGSMALPMCCATDTTGERSRARDGRLGLGRGQDLRA